jgi:hypothetical protein
LRRSRKGNGRLAPWLAEPSRKVCQVSKGLCAPGEWDSPDPGTARSSAREGIAGETVKAFEIAAWASRGSLAAEARGMRGTGIAVAGSIPGPHQRIRVASSIECERNARGSRCLRVRIAIIPRSDRDHPSIGSRSSLDRIAIIPRSDRDHPSIGSRSPLDRIAIIMGKGREPPRWALRLPFARPAILIRGEREPPP